MTAEIRDDEEEKLASTRLAGSEAKKTVGGKYQEILLAGGPRIQERYLLFI